MIDSNATMGASTLPGFFICARFYAQSVEKNVENGGKVKFMIGGIKLMGECKIQETRLDSISSKWEEVFIPRIKAFAVK